MELKWKRNFNFLITHKWDDDNPSHYGMGSYCRIQPGFTFKDGRYVAHKKLGWGSFSIVWLAWDTLLSQYVAIKFQIGSDHGISVAKKEIDILQQVASIDQQNQRCVVKLLDHFMYNYHVCMVFEYLGDNLIQLVKRYAPLGLPLHLVKKICLQILDGLDFFHTHFSLIHGDIKPENVCLLSPIDPSLDPLKSAASPILPPKQKSNVDEETSKIAESCTISLEQLALSHDDVSSVESMKSHDDLMCNRKDLLESLDHRCKLIDFGRVCPPGEGYRSSIQAIPYRSPEVILGDIPSFSTSADLWSFACVCFELATGHYLFPAEDGDDYCLDEDHLALMKQHLDRIPPAMIERGKLFTKKWFDNKGRLRNVPTRKRRTIKERLVEDYNFNEQDATELGDFLKWILKHEPTERPTAARCRRHKWFNDVKDEHFSSKTKLNNVNVVEDGHFTSESKESGPREETKLKNVNDAEDEHFSSKTKWKNVNVDGEHFISRSKEKQILKYYEPMKRPIWSKCISFERTKLKNANAVEHEHFISKSKGKQILKRRPENTETEKPESKNENVSTSGHCKNSKAKRLRDRRLNPPIYT